MNSNYSTMIVGDFNINMLINIPQSKTWQNYMDKYEFKKKFFENTTFNNTQIDHIWTNAPTQQCHVGSTKAYWTNHKPIYILHFKLPNFVHQFILS
jgi:hypothetical protein